MESQYTVHTRPRALTTGQGRKRLAVAAFAAAGFHPKRDLIKPATLAFNFFNNTI
jgi:hypothetical protein